MCASIQNYTVSTSMTGKIETENIILLESKIQVFIGYFWFSVEAESILL